MSVTLITTSFLNSAFYIASTGDELWLLPGIVISNNYDPAVTLTGAGSALISDGTILARIAGPGLSMTGADTSLVFGASSIYRSAACVGSPSILSTGGTASVTNHGLISTAKGTAMGLLGGGNSIYNDGTIEGGSGGVFVGINGGVGDRLVNYGTITAGNAQLAAFSERFNHAVQIEGSGSVLINHGTLAAVAAFGSGVNIGSFNFTGAGSRVENYGAITSALWWGVDMVTLTNGGATLYNHGLITGGTGGVRGSAFDDVVTNSGTVQGSIILNTGNDRYDGRGGMVFGQIGDGNDTLIGGAQDDDMDGGLGNDTVRGGAGDDTITGGAGRDARGAGCDRGRIGRHAQHFGHHGLPQAAGGGTG